jgi:hypothetical protein
MSDEPVVVFDPAIHTTFQPAERTLEENEVVIRDGLRTFVDVGRALLDIRNAGQYREAGFETFDDYCKERWGFGKSWASEHIAGAKVVDVLSVRNPEQLPTNLTQTRALVRLLDRKGSEAMQDAWGEIVEAHQGDGAITAREIRAHIDPAGSVAPSQRPVSDAYLVSLDKLNATLGSFRWSVGRGQGSKVPRPVAERYAEYVEAVEALADAVKAIANGDTPKPDSLGAKT